MVIAFSGCATVTGGGVNTSNVSISQNNYEIVKHVNGEGTYRALLGILPMSSTDIFNKAMVDLYL